MSYLLDTNVLSELSRTSPNPAVIDWLRSPDPRLMNISVLSIGEMRRGIEALKPRDRRRAAKLDLWLTGICADYRDRIIEVDLPVVETWARITAKRSLPVIDSLIAATAIVNELSLVTRNMKDMQDTGVSLINPWSD